MAGRGRPLDGRSSAHRQVNLSGSYGYSNLSDMQLALEAFREDEIDLKNRQENPHPHGIETENPYFGR
jgi:hypothetical protein